MRAAAAVRSAVLVALISLLSAHAAALGLEAAGAVEAAPAAAAHPSAIEHATGACQDRVEEELHHEQRIRLVLRDESIVAGRYRGIENGRLLLWQSPGDDENGELLSHNLESVQRIQYYTTGGINLEWPIAGAAIGLIGGALGYALTSDGGEPCGEPPCGLEAAGVAIKSAGIGALIGMAVSPFLPTSHKISCIPNERRKRLE